MDRKTRLNLLYRYHIIVGLVLSLWLYFFLVLVGPFDAADLSIGLRTIIMIGYGMAFFCCYILLIPIQNFLYRYNGKWNLNYEIAIILLFYIYSLPITYAYYKTEIVNGTYTFKEFSLLIYLPTLIILTPMVVFSRYIVARYGDNKSKTGTVTLLGENKLDVLKTSKTNLVALEGANNYVAVYYLFDGHLQKKLLRTTLRKVHKLVPEMIQVHRSYLINPDHFVEWKDGVSMTLTQLTVPVSKKYKSSLVSRFAFTTK